MKTCKEMASIWKLSERRVAELCKKGKVSGAYKEGNIWRIPEDAPKPSDSRIVSGKYVGKLKKTPKKPLPIGISDYVRAQSEYYYVDKTLMIRDILDRRSLVSLFTRPRRFGKTLNMDMLRVFFEISKEDTSVYFKDKAIWSCGNRYREHQGKYPVIFLSFKDVKYNTWEATFNKITELLQEEFGRHCELKDSHKLEEYEKKYYNKILSGDVNEVELSSSLQKLSKMLATHYGKAPIIIIDEYDTPIQEGYSKEFYDEIVGFMRNFFSGAFKDNKNLSYGFLTGILRIAQESLFSGLNNLTVNSLIDDEYNIFFGFTEEEVWQMLKYYDAEDKKEEVKNWYNGYIFGNREVYNPWSVINYISKGYLPRPYWVNTGKNEILEEVLTTSAKDIEEDLYRLLRGEEVVARIDRDVVYSSLTEEPENIYSLLLVAGYLKTGEKQLKDDGTWLCRVSVPNREIAAVYKSEVLAHLIRTGAVGRATANKIAESLYLSSSEKLQEGIREYLEKTVSFYDGSAESFYHGLLLGLVALMDNRYDIRSNRESGEGRYDISLIPKNIKDTGIIMELKWAKGLKERELDTLSQEALQQIESKGYDREMKAENISNILKIGIAFSGKKVKIAQ